jgi:hypothetical protein
MIKEHHCLGDGASNICMNMCLSNNYDPRQLLPYKMSIFEKLMAYLFLPFYFPSIVKLLLFSGGNKNELKNI